MNTELRAIMNFLLDTQDAIRKLLPDTPQRKRLAVKLADAAAIIAVAGRDIAVEQLDKDSSCVMCQKEDATHTRAVAHNAAQQQVNEKEVSA